MSNLSFFEFRSNRVRTIVINGVIAFCLGDVLGAVRSTTTIGDTKMAISESLGEGYVINHPLQTEGGMQNASFVLEPGLTFLLSRSRTESGKQLNRKIHNEILPSIRKTGTFGIENLSRREILRLALEAEDRILELETQIEADADATTLGKAIAKAPNNIRIGDFAKSIDSGQNRYFNELRDDGIIQQTSNLPYQQHINAGYFVVTQIIAANGRTYPVALITPKGQAYLVKRHKKYISRETMRDAIECQVGALV